jgi:hypothetical protein
MISPFKTETSKLLLLQLIEDLQKMAQIGKKHPVANVSWMKANNFDQLEVLVTTQVKPFPCNSG